MTADITWQRGDPDRGRESVLLPPLTPSPSPALGRGEPILEGLPQHQTKRAEVSL